jgi:hypothetical protein
MLRQCLTGGNLAAAAMAALVLAATVRGAEPDSKPAAAAPGREARCTDGSLMKLSLLDEQLRLKTKYGELLIPASDIQRIEFATRIPKEIAQRIEAAIERLGAAEFDVRDAASAELFSHQERAYPALVRAQDDKDAEVAYRIEQLLDKLRETISAERLEIRERDLVVTEDSTIAGLLEGETLRVRTAQFGEQRLKLSDLASIGTPGASAPEAQDALPDPGSLSQFQGQAGKTLSFRVNAAAQQFSSVWGTDVYTLDSSLALAAVHAGVLKPGQGGVVRVAILGPQPAFTGSSRNGVNTSSWGQFPGAFQFKR